MALLDDLRRLREQLVVMEVRQAETLASIDPTYRESARNLLHAIAFHQHNHPGLVTALREQGLSSLEGCEGHLAASLEAVIRALEKLEGPFPPPVATPRDPLPRQPDGPSHRRSLELSKQRSLALFGPSAELGARVIMVTLPAEAADRPAWVAELVEAGMAIARINCAHDTPAVWERCVHNVRLAATSTGRPCRIAMDLAGPKLRTGSLPPEEGVVDGRPRRDRYGRLLQPARLLASPPPITTPPGLGTGSEPEETPLPVLSEGWQALEPGHRLRGRDGSGRWRELLVVETGSWGVRLRCSQRCRFTGGLRFVQEGGGGYIVVAPLPTVPGERLLRVGDRLRLTKGASNSDDAIPCSCPEVFACVKEGEPVVFDEGRIQGLIEAVQPEELVVRITKARPRGSRLRADKSINLPGSHLTIPALGAKDRQDLDFVGSHAEILQLSFVHREADLEAFHQERIRLAHDRLALVLKIETHQAFLNLPRLLLAAMAYPTPLGVMIARGDLAVECGWEALASIQEEILHVCAAAHVPCIWATQVLETMVRGGSPTRAEITDAAMGARADALMLNKGPNLTDTLHTLREIVDGVETRLPEHGRHRDQWRSCLSFPPL
jgi:pyruvate kinase